MNLDKTGSIQWCRNLFTNKEVLNTEQHKRKNIRDTKDTIRFLNAILVELDSEIIFPQINSKPKLSQSVLFWLSTKQNSNCNNVDKNKQMSSRNNINKLVKSINKLKLAFLTINEPI